MHIYGAHTCTHTHIQTRLHQYHKTTVKIIELYFSTALSGRNVTVVIQFQADYFGEGGLEDILNNLETSVS